jgi:N-acetylglucosamine-6-phosphate deacetylase
VVNGALSWHGAAITGIDPAPRAPRHWIVPGFVDMHVHGGGGATFTTGEPDEARSAARFHAGHGTTTLVASLVSSPLELMRKATEAFVPLVADGTLAGIHYEGPYLAAACRGAQNPAFLRDPSVAELADLIGIAGGIVRMVTIAPELPGALEAIRFLVARDVTVALGHTDADYAQTLAGIAAGATVGTHVFNGMRPPHHRVPGPVLALLGHPGVVCELIADGIHLHDGTLAFALRTASPRGAALITDAIAAAGMADGVYELGGQSVTVSAGAARLTRPDGSAGAIAGSTLTMAAAFRRAVNAGASIVDAAALAAGTPARALGLADRGALQVGRRADAVVLSERLEVMRVLRGGVWLD